MSNFWDDIRAIVDDAEKTEKALSYWSEENTNLRNNNEKAIREWNRKSDICLINSLIMWISMIVVTIVCWILFDNITELFGIYDTLLSFLAVLGVDMVVNLIIAIVLHIFRH